MSAAAATIEKRRVAAAELNSEKPAAAISSSQRQPELDALRGFFLIWMTLTHLPTGVSVYSNQTFGFVSAAEGFIFLSALLSGKIFGRKLKSDGARSVQGKLWARAGRLYGYHLALLGVAFTVVAGLAIHTKQPSLQGLVDFYLAHPVRGVFSSLFLIYQPPLLDILPMYIVFLLLTPVLLQIGSRRGWTAIICGSVALWMAAQFGLKAGVYWAVTSVTHFDIPFSALGAFDFFAWQLMWVAGLWIGTGQPRIVNLPARPKLAVAVAAVLGVFLAYARHSWLWDVANNAPWAPLTDKWHLGPVRLLNFTCFAILFRAVQGPVAEFVSKSKLVQPLVLLGQSSLEVFCTHLLVCFAALALFADRPTAPAWYVQGITIAVCFVILYLVARMRAKTAAR